MKRLLLVCLASALGMVGVVPASAGTQEEPEITDAAGDANGVNGQGILLGMENGPDTRPASWNGADLRSVRFETAYRAEKQLDAGGSVTAVRHVPTGLRIVITTEGPAAPSPGPTLVYRVPANILWTDWLGRSQTCRVFFQMWIRGPASSPTDSPQRVDIRKLAGAPSCPGGSGTIAPDRFLFRLSFQENDAVLELPFNQFGQRSSADYTGFLEPGVEIAGPSAHVRPLLGVVTAPAIDEAAQGAPFVVGSDVPPDVDCAADPENEACQTEG